MSRKDYIRFAALLNTEREAASEIANPDARFAALTVVQNTTAKMVSIFAADNPNFDPARFREAVGY